MNAKLSWAEIHTVLLDLDGTLLDLNFDNVFFQEIVPNAFAEKEKIALPAAKARVMDSYQEVAGTLAWYDLDHWSRVLGLDIPLLKESIAHLIQIHPHVLPFLHSLQARGTPGHLVTNAHPHSLKLKFRCTGIDRFLASVTSSNELGMPKEDPTFWAVLLRKIHFDPNKTLLVDDSEAVLASAKTFGIAHLRHVAKASSKQNPKLSDQFTSILDFQEIMPRTCRHSITIDP